jgi:transcriptional regulator with XRE-family HTH domain
VEVAGRIGLSQFSIAQLEQGRQIPALLQLDRLARLYGRDLQAFLADEFEAADPQAALFRAEPTRLLSLALEDYRREKITRRKLREVAEDAGFSDLEIDALFAGTDPDEDAVDVLLPGDEI